MTIKSFINRYSSLLMALAVLVALFLFWFVGYPQALNYQEENQLFLFSTDYFFSRFAVAGDWPTGLASSSSSFTIFPGSEHWPLRSSALQCRD